MARAKCSCVDATIPRKTMTTIRPAGLGDEETLARLSTFAQQLHLERRPDLFVETQTSELVAWYRSVLEKETTRAWIAEVDGLAVGYVLAFVRRATRNPFVRERTWFEIDQVAVDTAHRRGGIARDLLEQALKTAKADGAGEVAASCWSFNDAAQALFRQSGFRPKMVRFEREA